MDQLGSKEEGGNGVGRGKVKGKKLRIRGGTVEFVIKE